VAAPLVCRDQEDVAAHQVSPVQFAAASMESYYPAAVEPASAGTLPRPPRYGRLEPPTMSARRALLLVNVKARQGSIQLPHALACLRSRGFDLVDMPTDHPDDIPDAIRQQAGKV